jgi:hypothetical protein
MTTQHPAMIDHGKYLRGLKKTEAPRAVRPAWKGRHQRIQDRRRFTMTGWRARIGFLVPPGNPTAEPEMAELVPAGVSVHVTRMPVSAAAG